MGLGQLDQGTSTLGSTTSFRVLWTGLAEVLQPRQEPGEGQEDLHWGLPVWRT